MKKIIKYPLLLLLLFSIGMLILLMFATLIFLPFIPLILFLCAITSWILEKDRKDKKIKKR